MRKLALIALAAAAVGFAVPLAAEAQSAAKVYRVGLVFTSPPVALRTPRRRPIWIITKADRSANSTLVPEEY